MVWAGGEVLTNLEVEGACADYCYLNLVAPSNVVGEGEEQKLPESEVLAEGAFLGLPSLEGQVVPAWVLKKHIKSNAIITLTHLSFLNTRRQIHDPLQVVLQFPHLTLYTF